jgi:hypothetical protein
MAERAVYRYAQREGTKGAVQFFLPLLEIFLRGTAGSLK